MEKLSKEEIKRLDLKPTEPIKGKRRFSDIFKEELAKMDSKKGSNAEQIVRAIVSQAKEGNIRAFESIRDTIGEKPVDNIHAQIEPPTFVEDLKK